MFDITGPATSKHCKADRYELMPPSTTQRNAMRHAIKYDVFADAPPTFVANKFAFAIHDQTHVHRDACQSAFPHWQRKKIPAIRKRRWRCGNAAEEPTSATWQLVACFEEDLSRAELQGEKATSRQTRVLGHHDAPRAAVNLPGRETCQQSRPNKRASPLPVKASVYNRTSHFLAETRSTCCVPQNVHARAVLFPAAGGERRYPIAGDIRSSTTKYNNLQRRHTANPFSAAQASTA